MPRDPRNQSTSRPRAVLWAALGVHLCLAGACRPTPSGYGRATLLESRLGPSSWSVLVDDQGQGVDLQVDGSPRQAQCRRTGQGIRCWVGGLRAGFHRLAIQVGGRGTTRRTALSPAAAPEDLVIYELVVDRFADGDPGNNLRVRPGDLAAPQGGDLAGIRARLPFLASLGVNALLLSPVWDHARSGKGPGGLPAYLGQRPLSPAAAERLSPAFGEAHTLMRLLSAARRRGLRVLLDLPRPEGWPLGRYFEVVRGWISRTQADGVRIGPPGAGEEASWAARTHRLAERFSPLVLLHRPGKRAASLRRALAPLPATSRILEDRTVGLALLGALGCVGQGGNPAEPLGAPPSPSARVLSEVTAPFVAGRCLRPGEGVLAGERATRRAELALSTHLLLAGIPVIFYADGVEETESSAGLPALDWTTTERSGRHQQLRRLLSLRRGVAALRGGTQRVRVLGDTVIVTRGQGSCLALVVVHRGTAARKLPLPLADLGWPQAAPGAAGGAGATTVEFVERLSGRGVAAENGLLTLELEPQSVSVLVPAGQDGCRG